MKKFIVFIALAILLVSPRILFSKQNNDSTLRELTLKFHQKYSKQKNEAIKKAKEKGWTIRYNAKDASTIEIVGLEKNGMPIYNTTNNINSAKTISTDHLWSEGVANLDLSGKDFLIGEWDGGLVRNTHQEFQDENGNSRISLHDVGDFHDHSTHVAGTIIAKGEDPNAHGMAYKASLDS